MSGFTHQLSKEFSAWLQGEGKNASKDEVLARLTHEFDSSGVLDDESMDFRAAIINSALDDVMSHVFLIKSMDDMKSGKYPLVGYSVDIGDGVMIELLPSDTAKDYESVAAIFKDVGRVVTPYTLIEHLLSVGYYLSTVINIDFQEPKTEFLVSVINTAWIHNEPSTSLQTEPEDVWSAAIEEIDEDDFLHDGDEHLFNGSLNDIVAMLADMISANMQHLSEDELETEDSDDEGRDD